MTLGRLLLLAAIGVGFLLVNSVLFLLAISQAIATSPIFGNGTDSFLLVMLFGFLVVLLGQAVALVYVFGTKWNDWLGLMEVLGGGLAIYISVPMLGRVFHISASIGEELIIWTAPPISLWLMVHIAAQRAVNRRQSQLGAGSFRTLGRQISASVVVLLLGIVGLGLSDSIVAILAIYVALGLLVPVIYALPARRHGHGGLSGQSGAEVR